MQAINSSFSLLFGRISTGCVLRHYSLITLAMGSPRLLPVLARFCSDGWDVNQRRKQMLGWKPSQDGQSCNEELLHQTTAAREKGLQSEEGGPRVGVFRWLSRLVPWFWGEISTSVQGTLTGGGRVSRNSHILFKSIACKGFTLRCRALYPQSSPKGLAGAPARKSQI